MDTQCFFSFLRGIDFPLFRSLIVFLSLPLSADVTMAEVLLISQTRDRPPLFPCIGRCDGLTPLYESHQGWS